MLVVRGVDWLKCLFAAYSQESWKVFTFDFNFVSTMFELLVVFLLVNHIVPY